MTHSRDVVAEKKASNVYNLKTGPPQNLSIIVTWLETAQFELQSGVRGESENSTIMTLGLYLA